MDNQTGKRTSLGSADLHAARQIISAKNEAERQPALNLQLAKAYLAGTDSGITTRTLADALEALTSSKQPSNQRRWRTVAKDKALAPILPKVITETSGELLLKAIQVGCVSTNIYLLRLHNFCVDMNWLPWPLIPKRQWPVIRYKPKRAITWEEHSQIIARERNPERRAFYQLAWHLGASQSDLAHLQAEDVDWTARIICFVRIKLRWRDVQPPQIRFGAVPEMTFPRIMVMSANTPYGIIFILMKSATLGRYAIILAFVSIALPWGIAGERDALIHFEIPAGDAQVTLRKFTDQAGLQIIYRSNWGKIQTQPISGQFIARDALDRMLAGTGLSTWQDDQTGALAVAGVASVEPLNAASARPPVLLPPFVVEETISKPTLWRYAGGAGFEVISRCSDATTVQLIDQQYAMHALLDEILPSTLRFQSDVPTSYLFFNDGEQAGLSKELLSTLKRREDEVAIAHRAAHISPRITQIAELLNYRFWDQDSQSIFFVTDVTGVGALTLTPSYVRYLLESRTPSLPRWFIDGYVELYSHVTIHTATVLEGHPVADSNTITIGSLPWRAGGRPLSLKELFSDRRADNVKFDKRRIATAAVVIRWMLDSSASRRATLPFTKEEKIAAFWDFLKNGATTSDREALFEKCFRTNYAKIDKEINGYYLADGAPFRVSPAKWPESPPVELRDATAPEVARIKGRFNRLEIAYVKEVFPTATGEYLKQARRTLKKAYSSGNRDVQLLADLGLCECEAENDADAEPFLEMAVTGKVVRPRAYYELGRIRFEKFRTQPGSAPMTMAQLESVVSPLVAMRSQRPLLWEAYDLMAEAYLRSGSAPPEEHMAILREGVRAFPRKSRLILSVALIHAMCGDIPVARKLIAQGLAISDDQIERARFEKLANAINEQTN